MRMNLLMRLPSPFLSNPYAVTATVGSLILRNTFRTTDKYNIMNIAFVEAAVVKALLHKTHGVSEIIHVQLLEPRLRRRRQGSPGAFELRPETLNGLVISSQFLSFVLALKLLHAEIHNPDVEVLASQLRVTCGVAFTSKMPPSIVKRETSKVPPPIS